MQAKINQFLSNDTMHLIVMPTERCNCRCFYCYEDLSKGKMSPEIVSALKKLIERRAQTLTFLHLSWFGGEPLLAQDLVSDISLFASDSRWPHLKFSSDITTNGYLLTAPVFQRLVDCGIRQYHVTLDGPKDLHDKIRVLADGGPTFDLIWANLLSISRSKQDVSVSVRIHYSGWTDTDGFEGFLSNVAAAFGQDSRFDFFVRPISRLGGANDAHIDRTDDLSSRINAIATSKLPRLHLFEDYHTSKYICYAAKPNSLVIGADGSIYKCTVAFRTERNRIGQLLPSGELEIDQDNFRFWISGLFSDNPSTLACPLSQLRQ